MNRLFSFIRVSGSDAAQFLQGQLTQDIGKLETTDGLLAGWCNARGRVITVARLVAQAEDDIILIVPHASAEAVVRRLSMFRLRARVDLQQVDDAWHQAAVDSPRYLAELDAVGLLPGRGRFSCRQSAGLFAFDIGAAGRCIEIFGTSAAFEAAGLDRQRGLGDDDWQSALVAAGVPHITPDSSERFTAHMLNLDLLGAISFDKGCYSGQEVIARTQHLGQSKRRLSRYRLGSGAAVPGQKLELDGVTVGEIVNAAGPGLLAVVPIDLATRALLTTGGGAAVTPADLPYALPGR